MSDIAGKISDGQNAISKFSDLTTALTTCSKGTFILSITAKLYAVDQCFFAIGVAIMGGGAGAPSPEA